MKLITKLTIFFDTLHLEIMSLSNALDNINFIKNRSNILSYMFVRLVGDALIICLIPVMFLCNIFKKVNENE